MKHLTVAILSIALVTALSISDAKADFVIVDSQKSKAITKTEVPASAPKVAPVEEVKTTTVVAHTPSSTPGVLMVGTPVPSPKLEGWANQVPLFIAFQQVLPEGWTANYDGVDLNKVVSWSGGKPWPSVLSRIGSVYGFSSKIDWDKKVVSVSSAPSALIAPVVEEPKAIAPPVVIETTTTVKAVETAVIRKEVEKAPEVSAPVIIKPVEVVGPKMHTLIAGKSLRENIEIWAQNDGWTVVWEGADYPIVAKASFSGEFQDEGGPIDVVISAYDSSDQPLLAVVKLRDRVIHVTNRNYNNPSILPSSPAEVAPDSFKR